MKIDFWSSTEYSGFMTGLIRELRERGLDARQRYQISEASYRAAKSPAARLFLRFRQYVVYPFQLCCCLLTRRRVRSERGDAPSSEIAVVCTNTFYAPLLATLFHKRVVHLVYDLFPEAMIHSGKWREGSFKVKAVRWITRKTFERASVNVFLGERLKDYVESIHGPVSNAVIIPVGADQSLFRLSPKQRVESEGGDTIALRQAQGSIQSSASIVYCGNFGNMHDSATLFAYWRGDGDKGMAVPDTECEARHPHRGSRIPHPASRFPHLTWSFHCSGPKRAALGAAVHKLPEPLRATIMIGSGLSQKEWVTAMEQADVALVTMTLGAETVVMPSKTYSAMMAGQAILAIAPEDSDLVDLIKTANCGWWVEPGDVEGLAAAVEIIKSDPEGLLAKRECAYRYAHKQLGQDTLAKEWLKALKLD